MFFPVESLQFSLKLHSYGLKIHATIYYVAIFKSVHTDNSLDAGHVLFQGLDDQ